ncbi:MAG: 16S rRNA (guanine(966)-N(2))-methyltransferase RsmD [Cyanobacteriota bacterium]|nr:16S rRNA (guanine(966)-N(2))-methyltransferase RsmD [Cyanobacteriota bacterium]
MVLRLSGGRRLQSPRGEVARPTTGRVRSAVMNMLAPELRGCRWLELCGGSAAMACEALQRGAACVVVVERDPRVAAVARANLSAVAAALAKDGPSEPVVTVVRQEALRFLRRGVAANGLVPFDLIYADPPWAAGLHGPLATAAARGGWLAPGGTLIWECAQDAALEIPSGWQEKQRRAYGSSELVFLAAEQRGSSC